MIDRRNFVMGAPLVAAPTVLTSEAAASTAVTLTAASFWPASQDGPGAAAARFAKTLSDTSGGAIAVELVPAPAGGALGLYDAVSSGAIDICFGAEEMWRSRNPAYGLFSSPPGGMTATEFESWIKWGGGRDVWSALAAQAGVTPFLVGDRAASQTLLVSPALDLSELAGATVAATGLAIDLWSALGAGGVQDASAPNVAALADIYNGDDARGALDLAPGRFAARLSRPMNRINNAISMNINSDAYGRLSEQQKTILSLAADAEHMAQRVDALVASHQMAERVLGIATVDPPNAFSTNQALATANLLTEIGDYDELASEVVWSFQLHQEDVSGWSAIGEGAYLSARNAVGAGK